MFRSAWLRIIIKITTCLTSYPTISAAGALETSRILASGHTANDGKPIEGLGRWPERVGRPLLAVIHSFWPSDQLQRAIPHKIGHFLHYIEATRTNWP